ncbi:MAG: methyltransferase domain-containing protein [bacterium]|nr:methyltransferase domain-containing protein [bacterium]
MLYLSIAKWAESTHRVPCLDVRNELDFRMCHLIGAGNIPFAEIEDRVHEMPRKGGELYVVGGAMAGRAAEELHKRGRWYIVWSDEELTGQPDTLLGNSPPAPLWSPNLWLKENWQLIPEGGRVFDVAMGSGRSAVFLALKGYRVSGEDILPDALEFADKLARRHGVVVDTRAGDLRRPNPLEAGSWDGITVFNYLDRKLLPHLKEALAPGGVIIYETFTEAQGRLVGRPSNPQWLLKPMELMKAFADLEIIAYREGSPENDRHVASLVARKPTS